MSKPIFPVLREKAPLMDLFREKAAVLPGQELTPAQKSMAEEFRIGLAEKLGVPPEAIRDELVEKWIRNWARAWVKPEFWAQKGYIRRLAQDLIDMISMRPQSSPEVSGQDVRERPRGTPSEQERRERYSRSEISVEK